MSTVHLFTAGMQPAVRFVDRNDIKPIRFRFKARHLFRCRKCGEKRWAKYLRVQVFYDGIRFWCAKGRGCNV